MIVDVLLFVDIVNDIGRVRYKKWIKCLRPVIGDFIRAYGEGFEVVHVIIRNDSEILEVITEPVYGIKSISGDFLTGAGFECCE